MNSLCSKLQYILCTTLLGINLCVLSSCQAPDKNQKNVNYVDTPKSLFYKKHRYTQLKAKQKSLLNFQGQKHIDTTFFTTLEQNRLGWKKLIQEAKHDNINKNTLNTLVDSYNLTANLQLQIQYQRAYNFTRILSFEIIQTQTLSKEIASIYAKSLLASLKSIEHIYIDYHQVIFDKKQLELKQNTISTDSTSLIPYLTTLASYENNTSYIAKSLAALHYCKLPICVQEIFYFEHPNNKKDSPVKKKTLLKKQKSGFDLLTGIKKGIPLLEYTIIPWESIEELEKLTDDLISNRYHLGGGIGNYYRGFDNVYMRSGWAFKEYLIYLKGYGSGLNTVAQTPFQDKILHQYFMINMNYCCEQYYKFISSYMKYTLRMINYSLETAELFNKDSTTQALYHAYITDMTTRLQEHIKIIAQHNALANNFNTLVKYMETHRKEKLRKSLFNMAMYDTSTLYSAIEQVTILENETQNPSTEALLKRYHDLLKSLTILRSTEILLQKYTPIK